MKFIKLIIIAFVLIKSVIKCEFIETAESKEYHESLVEGINYYRDDLMCTKPVIGLNYILKDDSLVEKANAIFNNRGYNKFYKFTQVTPKTCKYDRGNYDFETIVTDFIAKCIIEGNNETNSGLSWLWNPSINAIGCVFNKNHTKYILCVFNRVYYDSDIKFERPKFEIDKVTNRSDLYTNTCRSSGRYPDLKTCILNDVIRRNIILNLNNVRNKTAISGNYTNLKYVTWDDDLEIVAANIIRLKLDATNVGDCYITKKYGNDTDAYYEYYDPEMLVYNINQFKTVLPSFIRERGSIVLAKIKHLQHDGLHRQYEWMYDAKLMAIGCAISKFLISEFRLVCLFNRDPERKFNLKTGSAFCSECLCTNNEYPYLCTADLNSPAVNNVYSTFIICVLCVWIILVFINIITISIYMRIFLKFKKQPKDDLYEMHTYETIDYRSRESLQIN